MHGRQAQEPYQPLERASLFLVILTTLTQDTVGLFVNILALCSRTYVYINK